jgi:hypothetical protein
MRRITVVCTLGAALMAGCGGSNSSTTSSSSRAVGTVTKSQATSYAHAVNLKPGDVPELTPVGAEKEVSPKPSGEEAARCAGAESRYRRVADVNSARFRGASVSPRETLTSEVAVWPTAGTAERNAAAEVGTRGRACTRHLLERLAIRTMTTRVRIAHLSVAWLPAPLHGAKDSFAARVTLSLAAEGPRAAPGASSAVLESPAASARTAQLRVYLDELGFVSGPAQISLTALSVKRPPSSATEHRLLALLYDRAQTHSV